MKRYLIGGVIIFFIAFSFTFIALFHKNSNKINAKEMLSGILKGNSGENRESQDKDNNLKTAQEIPSLAQEVNQEVDKETDQEDAVNNSQPENQTAAAKEDSQRQGVDDAPPPRMFPPQSR